MAYRCSSLQACPPAVPASRCTGPGAYPTGLAPRPPWDAAFLAGVPGTQTWLGFREGGQSLPTRGQQPCFGVNTVGLRPSPSSIFFQGPLFESGSTLRDTPAPSGKLGLVGAVPIMDSGGQQPPAFSRSCLEVEPPRTQLQVEAAAPAPTCGAAAAALPPDSAGSAGGAPGRTARPQERGGCRIGGDPALEAAPSARRPSVPPPCGAGPHNHPACPSGIQTAPWRKSSWNTASTRSSGWIPVGTQPLGSRWSVAPCVLGTMLSSSPRSRHPHSPRSPGHEEPRPIVLSTESPAALKLGTQQLIPKSLAVASKAKTPARHQSFGAAVLSREAARRDPKLLPAPSFSLD
ncbi:hypothetical protein H8959_005218 [Pygathrix nigripes]